MELVKGELYKVNLPLGKEGKYRCYFGGDIVQVDEIEPDRAECWCFDEEEEICYTISKKELVKATDSDVIDYFLDRVVWDELKVKTLEDKLVFKNNTMVVGCQVISPQDALEIADKIYQIYGE